jgi:hypothetical protein
VNKVAQMGVAERTELFAETAARLDLADAVVEKDFWVCWTLKQIFSIESFREKLLFKGGTSLSKVFNAISRFSEDIDLAVDYAALGFTGALDPRQEGISKTKQTKILEEMLRVCADYIKTDFVTELGKRFVEILGPSGWQLSIDENDPHIVRFYYPQSGIVAQPYIKPAVLLEMGTHAEFIPRSDFHIQPLAAKEFPKAFDEPEARVTALLGKRTFWEKVTILHAEFYRDEAKALPGRYSRHYYDVAMLSQSAIKDEALADFDLLRQVVRHKMTFYPAAWARYDLAVPGSLRLTPPEHRIAALKQDYQDMAVMIFGQPPAFEWILQQLAEVERTVNEEGA